MLLLAHAEAIVFMPLDLPPPQPSLPAELQPLKAELIRYGFTVRLERPPPV